MLPTDPPIGTEVGGGDLQRDTVLSHLVELVCQEVGFLHQHIGPNYVLFQLSQAALERLVPAMSHAIVTDSLRDIERIL